jgi:hypothetical protein
MQEDDRVPTTNGDVTHLAVTDAYATTGMIVFGRNPVRHGIAPLAIGGAVKRRPETGCDPRDQRASSNQVQLVARRAGWSRRRNPPSWRS